MPIFKKYFKYVKDNPDKLWFKRKLYGWGWTPATWQGWAVTLAYIALIVALGLTLDESSSDREALFMFVLPLLILTTLLLTICYKKGEKPRWTWGSDDSNHPKPNP